MISRAKTQKLQLGELLIESGAITQEQLVEALAYQKESGGNLLLGEVFEKLALCSEEQIMASLAAGYGVPFVRVSPRVADPRIMDVLPREFLEKYTVLPLFKVRNSLSMAINEPANVFLIEEVERLTGLEVLVVCATSKDILATLETHLPSANIFVIDDIFDDDAAAGELSLVEDRIDDITDLEAAADGSPVIKLVNYLVFSAVRDGASDIHIEPDDNLLRVRFRVDGRLYEKLRPPFKMLPAISSRIKIMAGLDISERRLPQDGGIHVLMDGRPIDLRVSTLAGQFGEKIVIRIIDNRNVLVNLEKLGFAYEMLKEWRKAITAPNGIVLVTGPTGSGKTTTLYGVLREINTEERNILTAEDPIEYQLPGVGQMQINPKIGLTFANCLRHILRQDPDVIMVGEVRDAETAKIAIHAALTGHLVFTTLHTNDSASAVTRLLDMGVEPYLVSSSIIGIMAQRLVRVICPKCKSACAPGEGEALIPDEGTVEQDGEIYRGIGCENCVQTGYYGRTGIFELLLVDDDIRELIMKRTGANLIKKAAVSKGMLTLRDDGVQKVRAGITTVEEVLRVTQSDLVEYEE